MTSAAAPRPEMRTGPFRGFGATFMWGLHLTFTGRRFFIITAVAFGLGAFLGVTAIAERNVWSLQNKQYFLWRLLDEQICVYLLPLCALMFVTTGFSREVSQRTLVYHLVRPVSRTTIFLARFASGLVPAAVVGTIMLCALVWTSGQKVPTEVWLAMPLVATAAAFLLGSVYYLFATIFRRGIVAALIYTFVLERALGNSRGAVQSLSMNFHVRSVYRGLVNDEFAERSEAVKRAIDPDVTNAFSGNATDVGMQVLTMLGKPEFSTLSTATWTVVGVGAAALLIGIWRTKRRDFALKD